jgi:hypothetical protein
MYSLSQANDQRRMGSAGVVVTAYHPDSISDVH